MLTQAAVTACCCYLKTAHVHCLLAAAPYCHLLCTAACKDVQYFSTSQDTDRHSTSCVSNYGIKGHGLLSQKAQDNTPQGTEKKPALSQKERFIDKLHITARAGKGGNGSIAYELVARGRHLAAAGGNGGHGGSVVLRASLDRIGLGGINAVLRASDGGSGGRNGKTGASGRDLVVLVPVGTVVKELIAPASLHTSSAVEGVIDADAAHGQHSHIEHSERCITNHEGFQEGPEEVEEVEEWDEDGDEHETAGSMMNGRVNQQADAPVLAELLRDGQQVVVAVGGKGGYGNAAVRAAPNRPAPAKCGKGAPGQVVTLLLETKLLADVGFVGMPNAGKSSLLSALTAARAQVGSYAFTTLRPQLGTITYEDGSSLVTADIPGLIAGAHENRGRGNHFLRHIERTRCLAYVLDITGGQPGSLVGLPPVQQLQLLQEELLQYCSTLLDLPSIVVLNKLDICTAPEQALHELKAATQHPIIPISAARHIGLARLRAALHMLVPRPPLPRNEDARNS